ncbi:MAG: hypothetical protein ACP5OZ_00750, partial [Candidatus Woesearchaeota archaeon]
MKIKFEHASFLKSGLVFILFVFVLFSGFLVLAVDSSPPVTSIKGVLPNGSLYSFGSLAYANYVNISLNCSDTGGGVCKKTLYCIDTQNTCNPDLNYSNQIQIYTNEYAVRYVRFYSVDSANNAENVSYRIVKLWAPDYCPYLRVGWDGVSVGCCLSAGQCLVSSGGDVGKHLASDYFSAVSVSDLPRCVDSGEFIGDFYCDGGVWSSRTKFVALALLNFTRERNVGDYSLFCDSPDVVGNFLDYEPFS